MQPERDLERVLVVIAVTLEGSARRLVTIRSALQVTNNLEETVELRLEPSPYSLYSNKTLRVPPCTTYPIPMTYLMAQVNYLTKFKNSSSENCPVSALRLHHDLLIVIFYF